MPICEQDTYLIERAFDESFSKKAFSELKESTRWTQMQHRGGDVPRLISVQGQYKQHPDGTWWYPLYRHPADRQIECSPFDSIVQEVADVLNSKYAYLLPAGKEFNHVLVQWYRDGQDLITEHSDKTLDINPGTPIVNVTFGGTRVMTLRTKEKYESKRGLERRSERVELGDGSMFVLGEATNQKWLHGIRADKTGGVDERISLTFRSIGTFVRQDLRRIVGLGIEGNNEVAVENDAMAVEALFHMFSTENKSSTKTRSEIYGGGCSTLF